MFEKADAEYKAAQQELRDLETEYHKANRSLTMRIVKLRIARENACSHPSTYKEEDHNYHTNTEWTITYCKVCGKQLSRR